MDPSTSQTRKLALAGVIGLAVVAIVFGFFWLYWPAAQLNAPSDKLLEKLIAARPDQRDEMIIELGDRGPQVIPQVTAAYEKAGNEPDLRTQLAAVIFRTGAAAEAVPALEALMQKEKNPDVQRNIQGFIHGLRRSRRAAP